MTKYNWVQKTLILLSLAVFAAFIYFSLLIIENPEINQGDVLGADTESTYIVQFLNDDYSFTLSTKSFDEVINSTESIIKIGKIDGTEIVLSESLFINHHTYFELLQGTMFVDTKSDFKIMVNSELMTIAANSKVIINPNGDIVPIRGVAVDFRGIVAEPGQVFIWLVDEYKLRPHTLSELEINLDTIKLIYTLWDIDELPTELELFAPAV